MEHQPVNPDVSRRHRNEKKMITQFDVFRVRNDGNPIWVLTANTLEEARLQVRSMQEQEPGEYLIVSLQTGRQESVEDAKSAGAG